MESNEPPSSSRSPLRRLVNLDAALSLHLYSKAQSIFPRCLLIALEISGDGRLFFPITIALFVSPLASSPDGPISLLVRPFIINLVLGALFDLIVIGLIKHIVRRPRPVYNKGMFLTFAVDHWSFPSGHSSRVCFIASYLYLSSALIESSLVQLRSSGLEFFNKSRRLQSIDEAIAANYVVLIACSWATTTSISRILLGRHFVFDVVFGACLGVVEALFVFHVFNYSILSSILS